LFYLNTFSKFPLSSAISFVIRYTCTSAN